MGAITALIAITNENPKAIYRVIIKIISAAEKGFVITNDNYVAILIKLSAIKEYVKNAFGLLSERLMKSATNQLPMYAENVMAVANDNNKKIL